jgi:neutral ceramidase
MHRLAIGPFQLRVLMTLLLSTLLLPPPAGHAADGPATAWKAGAASIKITPGELMWMAGYASRTKPAERVAQDLFAKSLVLEDDAGHRLVMVTFDLVGIPRTLRDALARDLEATHHVAPETLLLNASHTHCGPEVRRERLPKGAAEDERARQGEEYVAQLRSRVVEVVGQAIARLAPARLDYLHARAGFAMNRRRPTPKGYINAQNSEGPVDQNVPVLRVTDADGKTLRALLFGYACHNTTLSFYEFCGDYAGFAQQYLQEAHPEAVALFLSGCGGDQNPYPRGTIELCRQHGRTLATAVEAALGTVPRPLSGPLQTAWAEVELEFAPPPSREELQRIASSPSGSDVLRRHADRLLKQLADTGRIKTTYSYPIQVVHFGGDLTLVALAGETVVDYSLRIQRELSGPASVWVAGYCNDVFGYVPSRRVLQEGGYEAGDAMRNTAFPGPFAPSVEERITLKALEMARRPVK